MIIVNSITGEILDNVPDHNDYIMIPQEEYDEYIDMLVSRQEMQDEMPQY